MLLDQDSSLEEKKTLTFSNTSARQISFSTKMAAFWDVTPCSLVEVYQRFRGTCCLHHQGDDADVRFYRVSN
jgi:hypothetical protein